MPKGLIALQLRFLSLIFSIVVLGWIATPIHEGLHQLVANSLGYEGIIRLGWGGSGFFEYVPPYPGPQDDALIGLAGGVGTGLLFLLFWLITGHPDIKKHPSEVNNTFPFLLFGIMQIIYAPFDGFLRGWTHYGTGLGMFIGFAVPVALYWRPVLKYIEGEKDA